MNQPWYEVWVDEGLTPPYVLLVLPDVANKVVVFDPKENRIAHEASGYEDAKLWLQEDEYRRVEGRMTPDEL
jgi:hypothetical protein